MTPAANDQIIQGRLDKALQFQSAAHVVLDLSDEHQDVADAVVTLAVHAGIAASDALCIAALGQYHQGKGHGEAVKLLKKVDTHAAQHLDLLLGLKTRAGYGYTPIAREQLKRAVRAMDALVLTARA